VLCIGLRRFIDKMTIGCCRFIFKLFFIWLSTDVIGMFLVFWRRLYANNINDNYNNIKKRNKNNNNNNKEQTTTDAAMMT